MDSLVITDDDRQTPSNDRSSSNDISSTTTEELLSVYEDDQQQISSTSDTLIRPVKVDNHISLPNLKIKHPCQTHDNYPFNTGKKMIINKHVKVSHINRSDLRSLNKEITLLRLNNLKNRQTTQITSRQSTVRICRVSTADNINQGSNKKVIASKYMVTKLPLSNELPLPLPLKMKQKELHVSVKHVSVNANKSS
jgi:hypothetical protein